MLLTNKADDAFQNLADSLIHTSFTLEEIRREGFSLKHGKTLQDIRQASTLQDGQTPGSYERMVAHIENNLREVLDYTGAITNF